MAPQMLAVGSRGIFWLQSNNRIRIHRSRSWKYFLADEGAACCLPGQPAGVVFSQLGDGKTHVAGAACSAGLIRDGANPNRIWIISFTRTAVFEIRNRIASALETGDAASVRIATLDSHAWSMQSGFSPDATLTGSHDKGIEETLRLLRDDPQMADYLQRLDHLVIDEGQDIVGARAALTLAFVDAVAPECGITVFADEAQAIYAFSEEEAESAAGSTLMDQLRARGFNSLSPTHVYRTQIQNSGAYLLKPASMFLIAP